MRFRCYVGAPGGEIVPYSKPAAGANEDDSVEALLKAGFRACLFALQTNSKSTNPLGALLSRTY